MINWSGGALGGPLCPERDAGFLPAGVKTINKEGSFIWWSVYCCGQSCVLRPITVQFSFSISSSENSLPGTTCSLDRLLPPWTWCQRRGFWALPRLYKRWDEVPGPPANWVPCCQERVRTSHLWKTFSGKEDNVRERRLNSWTVCISILRSPLVRWVTLAKRPHLSEPKDLKQYLAPNKHSKP